MGTFLKFDPYSLHTLNNAEYATYIARFLALLPLAEDPGEVEKPGELSLQDEPQLGAPSLKIPAETVARTKALLGTLTDLNKETRSSVETEQIAETEAARDEVATFIVNRVVNYNLLLLDAERSAGKLLLNTLKVYVGIARLPVSQETAAIKGMLLDLRKADLAGAATTLGLTTYMEKLEQLNNLYEEQVAGRNATRSAKSIGTTSKVVREEMDGLYEEMTDLAFASNLLNGTDETAAFIRDVNALIAQTRTARNQRGSKPKKETGGGDGERPGEMKA